MERRTRLLLAIAVSIFVAIPLLSGTIEHPADWPRLLASVPLPSHPQQAQDDTIRDLPSTFCGTGALDTAPRYLSERSSIDRLQDHPHPHIPVRHLRINDKGLRDEPFNATKPANTTRILVIGDSFTAGFGLNESQRYTEKLENRLNDRYQKTFQVINAGRPGAGMKDYYQFLYHKGIRYDPDIVIIAFNPTDAYSQERKDQWTRAAMQRYNITRQQLITHDTAKEWLRTRITAYLTNLSIDTAPIYRYGNMIDRLSERHGFRAVFFLVIPPHPSPASDWLYDPVRIDNIRYPLALNAWGQRCGRTFITAPDKLNRDVFTFPENSHYNARGNTVLADSLFRSLQERISANQRRGGR